MPIFATRDPVNLGGETLRQESTRGEVFQTMFGLGTEEGGIGSGARIDEYVSAEYGISPAQILMTRGMQGYQQPVSKRLDPEAARMKLRDAGLQESLSIPETGIRQDTLDILIRRKRAEIRRQTILDSSDAWGTKMAGYLAGSLVDPTNIALAFVPVVGEARYVQMLARAGGAAGRAGVRAGVGAAEGFVGLAPLEAMNYYANIQQQADYDAYDSMLALAGGAFFGSALHAGAGLFGDAIRPGKWNQPPRVAQDADGSVRPLSLTEPTPANMEPVFSPIARDRTLVINRIADGRPVTVPIVRTGVEAGTVIDTRISALQEAAQRNTLTPDEAKMLVKESDELEALVRGQRKAEADGVILSPANRLSAEDVAFAEDRLLTIRQQLEAGRTAQSAARQLADLEKKLSKIDSDKDLIALAKKLVGDDVEDFRAKLDPKVVAEVDRDPFGPVRPFVASWDPQTQARAFRMAIAQAMTGKNVDVSPAILTDPKYMAPDAARAAADANSKTVAGASEALSRWADGQPAMKDDLAALSELDAEVQGRMRDMGIEANADELATITAQAKATSAAARAAAICEMRGG